MGNLVENNKEIDEKKEARESALKDAKMYATNGWEIKEETPESFILTRNEGSTGAHIVIFCFTVWFTFGIANLIYYFAKKKKKIIMK